MQDCSLFKAIYYMPLPNGRLFLDHLNVISSDNVALHQEQEKTKTYIYL